MGSPEKPVGFLGRRRSKEASGDFSLKKKNEAKRTLLRREGYQNLIRINKEKGILIFGKNILRELKNILAELFSTGEIDRIDEIK